MPTADTVQNERHHRPKQVPTPYSFIRPQTGNLRKTDPKGQLYRAWQLKELLRTLLKHPVDQARGELRHWVFRVSHSRIPEIVELAKKIRGRRPDILRTIQLGYSNARLKAFNNRIKAPSAWPTASTT